MKLKFLKLLFNPHVIILNSFGDIMPWIESQITRAMQMINRWWRENEKEEEKSI